jgi:hypothetical protein
LEEGIEVQVPGRTLGIDPLRPAIKLPVVDRIGLARRWPRRLIRE